MTVAVIAGFAMFVGDIFQALYVILLDKGRAWMAGMFDGLADITVVVSIGGGASTVYHHSLDGVTAATLSLILAGSVLGAVVGDWLSSKVTHKPKVTQAAIR